ncbi:MAG: DUF1343 domain-containing protein [Spirochaetales bacterium]|nr:DUF1343 domain-containing protein [Spirochaetales bacterium]
MRKSIIFLILLFFTANISCSGDNEDVVSPLPPSFVKADTFPAVHSTTANAGFSLGSDQLFTEKYFHLVDGKKVAIMANITAKKTVDRLIDNPRVELVAIFGPEHGFFGKTAAGLAIDDTVYRGVPVYGCYGGGDETRRIPFNLLEYIDVLLFEVQDIGARYYTFISSMYLAMDSAADANIPFVVLDRPNAAGGDNLEGPMLEPAYQSFLGVGNFPIRYSMTIGEMALMFCGETELMHGPRYPRKNPADKYFNIKDLSLTIVPMTGYDRTLLWDEVMQGEPWVSTSPNIPGVMSALCFAGTGIMAGNTIDEIVKGFQQFQVLSFPFVNSREEMTAFITEAKKHYAFPGVSLSQAVHPETFAENIVVLEVYDPHVFKPVESSLALMYTQRVLYPDERFLTNEKAEELTQKVVGNDWLLSMLLSEILPPFSAILERIKAETEPFLAIRKKYLLY